MKTDNSKHFISAQPVWQRGMREEKNHTLLFRAVIEKAEAKIHIACSTAYRLCVNGAFAAAGPARAAEGFYRVDVTELSELLHEGKNIVSVLVAGYCVNSFEYCDAPSFLCAEITCGGEVLASTGVYNFDCIEYPQKLKRVQRYSFQRTFAEVYDYEPGYDRYMTDVSYSPACAELELTGESAFLPRGVAYPEYEITEAERIVSLGTVSYSEKQSYFADRAIDGLPDNYKKYPPGELDFFLSTEYGKLDFTATGGVTENCCAVDLPASSYALFDMGAELTGFIEFEVECDGDATIYASFDEILTDGDINCFRLGASSVCAWRLRAGKYSVCTFEPYSYRYIKITASCAEARIRGVRIRRYEFPSSEIKLRLQLPEKLAKIYDAAVATFRQNTLDIYMDCPSRERAGWLCDSFFTSRTEFALTGKTDVERNFIENFVLPGKFGYIPDGMLPMCYPSDHVDGVYIPNWAMWFVLELEEYAQRSGDAELVEAARSRVYGLLDFLRGFENADGLLEKLQSWVFIEWSKSNELTQDISYPSNMLYCKFKRTIARLYGDPSLEREAKELAEVIRSHSYMGDFFCDNSVYDENGSLRLSGQCSESCQYYAFFTEVATPQLYPQLWDTLVCDFGPERKSTKKWERIHFANAFIGNYLRLELLYRYNMYDRVLENIEGYFLKMAQATNTLWEHDSPSASCNHGFASHVIYWLKGIFEKR